MACLLIKLLAQTTGQPDLDPDLGIQLTADSTHAFLLRHLPTTPAQQHMLQAAMHRPTEQSSQPSKHHTADTEPHASMPEKKCQSQNESSAAAGSGASCVIASSAQAEGKVHRQGQNRVGQADRSELEKVLAGRIFKLELAHEMEVPESVAGSEAASRL